MPRSLQTFVRVPRWHLAWSACVLYRSVISHCGERAGTVLTVTQQLLYSCQQEGWIHLVVGLGSNIQGDPAGPGESQESEIKNPPPPPPHPPAQ